MVRQDDQPRPDLDVAIDAVVPSLTAVSDEAAAASLRRTRLALAERRGARRASAWGWSVAAVAAAAAIVLTTVSPWQRPAPAPATNVARGPAKAVGAPTLPASAAPRHEPPPVVPLRVVRPTRLAGAPHVQATSMSRVDEAPRPDPLVALVRAVQQIPEDAWARTVTAAQLPVSVPDARVTSIDVAPLDTPSLDGASTQSVSPGEP